MMNGLAIPLERAIAALRKYHHGLKIMAGGLTLSGGEPLMQDRFVVRLLAAAKELGFKTMRLPSGAGHDAQIMAKLGPMGMIFVPSVDGISHSPQELTRWEDCANGANVLLGTVLRMDQS